MMRVVLSIFAEATRAFARGESQLLFTKYIVPVKQLAHSREVRDEYILEENIKDETELEEEL